MYIEKKAITLSQLEFIKEFVAGSHIEEVDALPTTDIKTHFYYLIPEDKLYYYKGDHWRTVGSDAIIRVDSLPTGTFNHDVLYLMEHFYVVDKRYNTLHPPLEIVSATSAGLVINGIVHAWADVLADLPFYEGTYITEDTDGDIYTYHATVGAEADIAKMCYGNPSYMDGIYAYYNNGWHNLASGGGGGIDATFNTVRIEGNKDSFEYKIFWEGTQAQYDLLGTYDPYTLYFITDAETPILNSYNLLTDKPTINDVELKNNKTTTDLKILWTGTQAQYDAITTKNPQTIYCITDAD